VTWTSPENKLLVSQFSSDDGNTVSSAIIREWAGRIYDSEDAIRSTVGDLYDRDIEEVRPPDISPNTIRKLLKVVKPHTMMRTQFVGKIETVALEKKLREEPDVRLRNILTDLGIIDEDVDTLVKWRRDRPVWSVNGEYIPEEGMTGSEHNRFINRIAEQGPREMFVESCVAFVADPYTLRSRDPEMHEFLKADVFNDKDFLR